MDGIVDRFFADRGFGFIFPLIGKPDVAADVWFHVNQIVGRDPLNRTPVPEGCRVCFDLVRGKRGPVATNIRIKKLSGAVLLTSDEGREYSTESTCSRRPPGHLSKPLCNTPGDSPTCQKRTSVRKLSEGKI